ncbi:M24 family metallopeptidase [Streptacidiphilus anmyonensis]|uniref:M24 family metallopeptidase n=1 Tax=Streptacidiphilus anmyonensis TaxID=405782 RepID=UPI0005AA9A0A|nr:Xaa-Pro peptidase family protein [Streptacidiphilus anmyonensis]
MAHDASLPNADRIVRAQTAARAAGLDALLITPGADLRYLTGYEALPLERLTCLAVPAEGEPFLVVPLLEQPAAEASPVGALDLEIIPWRETEDPYALLASRLPRGIARVGLDNHMFAEKVLGFRSALPGVEQALAGGVLGELRVRKSAAEVAALLEAAEAIDKVHSAMEEWLRPGRTEREVGRDIADAIIASGHVRVDFVIVASGPNGASPHAEVSDRVIQPGEPVVVDIGGTMPSGYCSDSTRNYCLGARPPARYEALYEVLLHAQKEQCDAVAPGVTAEQLDAVGRDLIAKAGYGEFFIHRTGHGIGLETHEEPYIVAGSPLRLEPGMAFSVEPGIYLPGEFGARIEDIAVCTEEGGERLNLTSRDLRVLPV